jgi:hypothetical protein
MSYTRKIQSQLLGKLKLKTKIAATNDMSDRKFILLRVNYICAIISLRARSSGDRVFGSEPKGRKFNSCRAYSLLKSVKWFSQK